MTIQELIGSLELMSPNDEVIVALLHTDGTIEAFPIQAITDTDGQVWIEIARGSPSP